ncbi:MAG: hypothetical protein C4527_16670 [Candidatus Omnitrophota bacterium]|jgi:signal transduction histidine kinase|nr:MAG: hypothetical protein C4527_16670 [Candidatus Omnitrophota bacterium]
MHKILISLLILTFPLLSHSQEREAAPLGIFDATADWGWGVDSPETWAPYKKSGKVEIQVVNNDFAYDVYGGGGDIYDSPDEGFYVYTERSGSLSFSAKVLFLDKGQQENPWSKAGLMIRENPTAADSPFYFITLLGGIQKEIGDSIQAICRSWKGEEALFLYKITNHPSPGKPLYLRITRIVTEQLFYCEWSVDGQNWNLLQVYPCSRNDSLGYGLAVTNCMEDDQLAKGRFSEIRFSLPPPTAVRCMSTSHYIPFQTVNVVLKIHNFEKEPRSIMIQETIPAGWESSDISHDGKRIEDKIVWNTFISSGMIVLHYNLKAPADPAKSVPLYGEIESLPIFGQDSMIRGELSLPAMLSTVFYYTLFLSVPLAMILLHLSLYCFFPRLRENLYYALYLLSMIGTLQLSPSFDYHFQYPYAHELGMWIIQINSFHHACLLLFLYSLYYPRFPKITWILIGGLSIIALMIYAQWNLLVLPQLNSLHIYLVFVIVIYAEYLRIAWKIFHRRSPDTWFIPPGVLCLVCIHIWQLTQLFNNVPDNMMGLEWFWANLVIVICMSVSLAYRFAKTNRALETLNLELEDRVARRTEELEQANAELREFDKMKSAFVSQASHDLRTPLTAIKGSLDNLILGIAGALTEKQEKIMNRAVKSVDRLTDLVNDVLDLSRIESGMMVLEKSNVPIRTLVENIINENRPAAEQKRIQLFAYPETDVTMQADAGKLERVVGELISNAIKYTPEGGTIDVTLTQKDDQIMLSVKDSGIGMTKEECEKIWERFYRTNASKTVAKGSGLGLSIAKELVEMHGGTISVVSKQNQGTMFTVTFTSPDTRMKSN